MWGRDEQVRDLVTKVLSSFSLAKPQEGFIVDLYMQQMQNLWMSVPVLWVAQLPFIMNLLELYLLLG